MPVSPVAPAQVRPHVHSAPQCSRRARVWLSPSPLIKVSGNVGLMTSCAVWWIYLPRALPPLQPLPHSTCEGVQDSSLTRLSDQNICSKNAQALCGLTWVHRLYMHLVWPEPCAHISCAQCICQTLSLWVVQGKYSSRVNKPGEVEGKYFGRGSGSGPDMWECTVRRPVQFLACCVMCLSDLRSWAHLRLRLRLSLLYARWTGCWMKPSGYEAPLALICLV